MINNIGAISIDFTNIKFIAYISCMDQVFTVPQYTYIASPSSRKSSMIDIYLLRFS